MQRRRHTAEVHKQKAAQARASIALVLCVLCSMAGPAHAAGDELIGATSHDHVWLVLESGKPETIFQLVHHPADEREWYYRIQQTMSQAPVAMAAWDDTLWLIFSPRPGGDHWQREVRTTRVVRNPATGLYDSVPVGRLEMLPALPGAGRLAGVVATPSGPVALLLASSPTGVMPGAATVASQPSLEHPMLRRLARGASDWEELPLPPQFDGVDPAMLVAAGSDGEQLVILEAAPDNLSRSMRYLRQADGTWSVSSLPLEFRSVRTLTSVAGQVLAVLAERRAHEVELAYLRPGTVIPLASLPIPQGKWRIDSFHDRLVLVERDRGNDARLTVRNIDPLTGAMSLAEEVRRQTLAAGKLLAAGLVLGLGLSVALLFVLLRPATAVAITVAPERVLPIGRRLLGLAVDLAIGAVPAMLLLDCSPKDLLALPMFTLDFSPTTAGPYVVMAVISVAGSTALESLTGRSLGGMLVGARITGLDGAPPQRWRLLARALPKALVLLAPPLAVLALVNRHMQGLPDLVARTLVLSSDEPLPQPPTES